MPPFRFRFSLSALLLTVAVLLGCIGGWLARCNHGGGAVTSGRKPEAT